MSDRVPPTELGLPSCSGHLATLQDKVGGSLRGKNLGVPLAKSRGAEGAS